MIDGLVRGVKNPLCPAAATEPIAPEHRLHNAIVDAMYDAAPKDTDGELEASVDAVYTAAAHSQHDGRMRLYHHSTGNIVVGSVIISVGAWYYRCPTCGLTLPAQIESQFPEVRR